MFEQDTHTSDIIIFQTVCLLYSSKNNGKLIDGERVKKRKKKYILL